MSLQKNKKTNKKNYSIIHKFKKEKKIDDLFIFKLNSFSLEDIIAMKLEIATKESGGSLYGLPLWNSSATMIKDALLKTSISITKTYQEAATFLGINLETLFYNMNIYKPENYFLETEEKKNEFETLNDSIKNHPLKNSEIDSDET